MGHEITAITRKEDEIHLSNPGNNPRAKVIYQALNCLDKYKEYSGDGSEAYFSRQQIGKAIEFVRLLPDMYPKELSFLTDVYLSMEADDYVLIQFY